MLFDQGLINAEARLTIGQSDATPRRVHGVATRIKTFGADAQGRSSYELRIMPTTARLAQRRMRRIFQDKTVIEIAMQVLGAAPIEVIPKLARIYKPRTYCVQYDETDLAFVERLLAEEGIFYFFRHLEKKAQIVRVDRIKKAAALRIARTSPKARAGARVAESTAAIPLAYGFSTGELRRRSDLP